MPRLYALLWSAVLFAQSGAPAGAAHALLTDGRTQSFARELWRMSGRLVAHDGHEFFYSAIFFRYAKPHGTVLYPASISILDETKTRLFTDRRTERAGICFCEATGSALDMHVGAWQLHASLAVGATPAFDLDANLPGIVLRVHGSARKPRFALRTATTAYEGYSSVASAGTIAVDGPSVNVAGTSWFDYERSSAAPRDAGPIGQFRVQLDDGREIYVETSGPAQQRRRAYLIERDGSVDVLSGGSFEFGTIPGSTWRSPHTGTIYPDVWALHVDGKTEFLSIEPVAYDQESVARGNGLSYWDGPTEVYDVTPGSQGLRLGWGHVLMSGYARVPSQR